MLKKRKAFFIVFTQLAFVLSMLTVKQAFTQEEEGAFQAVKGKIIDKDSKSPLFGAVIIIVGSKPLLGNVSDSAGYFNIPNVPVGRQNVKVSYIGYEDVTIQNVLVTSEQDISLKIQMSESFHNIKEVIITAKLDKDKALNSMASISARAFSMDEAQRYAGGLTDPSRMAQAFAGVAATSSSNNEIVVRGNSPRGVLWRIEGIEIPSPNHFKQDEGATGGGICILSSNVITNSDFFTGAFPAEYGNALSGVFDLNLRKGSDEYFQSSVQLSFIGTEISLEGPLYKKRESSFLINYRYSTFSLLSQAGIKVSDETIIPQFQDLAFNVSLPSNKLGHTTVFGIMGMSSSGLKATKDTLLLADRTNRFEEFDQGNVWVTGITNNYLTSNNRTSFKTTIALMGEDNKMTNDTMDFNFNDHNIYNEDLSYTTFRASFLLNHKFSAKHTFRFGLIFSDAFYHLYSSGYNFDEHQQKNVFDSKGSACTLQSFIEWKYRVSDKITINSGLHFMRFFMNKDYSLEPRLGMVWQLSGAQSLSFGLGLHSRTEPISIYVTNIPQANNNNQPNKNIGLPKSFHAVLGYDFAFTEDLHFKIETYYQYLYNIPVGIGTDNQFSLLNLRYGFVTIPLENKGSGKNYGLDLTFEHYFTKSFYFMISGSIYDSRYTPTDGKEYNTTFNGNYIFNALYGKEWTLGKKKNKTIGINSRFLYRRGLRYQGIDLAADRKSTRLNSSH